MNRRYRLIVFITAALLIIAVSGYLLPPDTPAEPVRIFFQNPGGNVIFTHQKHSRSYDLACKQCHHYTAEGEVSPPKCGACHPKVFDGQFLDGHQSHFPNHAYCNACHHNSETSLFDHDEHISMTGEDCETCHHDATIEPEPESCSNCHEHEGDEDMPSLRTATHTRCTECHSDFFDKGIKGCSKCHTRTPGPLAEPEYEKPCADCHERPVSQLIPSRTNAFHEQCRGCHRTTGKGPHGDDLCYHCHFK